MRQPKSTNGGLSPHMDPYPAMIARRSRSNASLGRSRYRDSYMASTFKAIEPAPQPKLLLNDPADQMFLADLAGRQMAPLKGRSIPFTLYDADNKTILTDFSNLAELLRFRSTQSDHLRRDAFVLVDARGKEPESLTWEKLNARAEKIANSMRQKGNIKPGDRVALIYRKSEVLEFIPALFGCFLAGVTAVPINAAEDLSELSFILTLTNIYLILTTEYNQRAFTKDLQTKQVEFPASITWWNTNSMGTWYPPKKTAEYPVIKVPEVAYIEYAKASNGELKGVTVTHASIMEQCAAFQAATTETTVTTTSNGGVEVKPKQTGRVPDVVVSYFEPRQQIGLVLSVLNSVYAGNSMIFTSGSIVDTPAVWIYVLSKYKGKSLKKKQIA
jgi:acyl-CoA synthetase (AMP-forming)/AMP-acid ligase II